MEEIYLHPFTGALSAYGMGLADIRGICEATFSDTLDEAPAARAQVRGEGAYQAHRASFGLVPGITGRQINGLSVEAIGSAGNPAALQAGDTAISFLRLRRASLELIPWDSWRSASSRRSRTALIETSGY